MYTLDSLCTLCIYLQTSSEMSLTLTCVPGGTGQMHILPQPGPQLLGRHQERLVLTTSASIWNKVNIGSKGWNVYIAQ